MDHCPNVLSTLECAEKIQMGVLFIQHAPLEITEPKDVWNKV